MTIPTSFRDYERQRQSSRGRGQTRGNRWGELGEHAGRDRIWEAAHKVLTDAALEHLHRPSEQAEDVVLQYAIETYQRKLRWLQDNEPDEVRRFVAKSPPLQGENWGEQLIRLSNRYAHLASLDDSDLDDDNKYEELLASERALLSHCATVPTASGHTHRRREGAEKHVPGPGGATYSRSVCGPVLPDHNFSDDTATCPGCLSNSEVQSKLPGAQRRKPRKAGYIEVPCPTCGAVQGVDCTGSIAHPIPANQQFHQARQHLANLGRCETCGSESGVMCVDEQGNSRKAPHQGRRRTD